MGYKNEISMGNLSVSRGMWETAAQISSIFWFMVIPQEEDSEVKPCL